MDYDEVLSHHRHMISKGLDSSFEDVRKEALRDEMEVNAIVKEGINVKEKLFAIIDRKLKEPSPEIDFSNLTPDVAEKLKKALDVNG